MMDKRGRFMKDKRGTSLRRLACVLLAGALVAAACSSDKTSSVTTTPGTASGETTPSTAPAIQKGGMLRVAVPVEPPTMSPSFGGGAAASSRITSMSMFDRLVRRDPKGVPVLDGLLTGVKKENDITFLYDLRQGVKFHNGEPWNSTAFVYSFNIELANNAIKAQFGTMTLAQAAGDYQVRITTSAPIGADLVNVLLSEMVAYPPSYTKSVNIDAFGKYPVGTGPFMYKEWKPGVSLTVVRNPDYWGGPVPLDGIVYTFVPDAAARLAQLQSGGVDYITGLAPGTLKDVGSGLRVTSFDTVLKGFLELNMQDPTLSDIRVRQAISYAMDRDTLVKSILTDSGGTPSLSLFPPNLDTGAKTPYPYDPAKAKALIAAIKAEKGDVPTITLEHTTGRVPGDQEMSEAFEGMLKAVGFKVNRVDRVLADFFKILLAETLPGVHQMTASQLFPHPLYYLQNWGSTKASLTYCSDPKFDKLKADLLSGATDATKAIAEFERLITVEFVCQVPIYNVKDNIVSTSKVQGVVGRTDQQMQYTSLWLKK